MTSNEEIIKELVGESFRMTIVKKNLFDIILKMLENEGIKAETLHIISLINTIKMDRLRELENNFKDKKSYTEHFEKIVMKIINEYLKGIDET